MGNGKRVAKEKETRKGGGRKAPLPITTVFSHDHPPRPHVPLPLFGPDPTIFVFRILRYQMNNSIDGGRLADRASRQGDSNQNHGA